MAVTATLVSIDQVKGPFAGSPGSAPYHVFRGTLNLSGTYATGGFQVDLCNFFQGTATTPPLTGARAGVTAIAVNWVKAFGDYNDGTNALTIADGQTALANGGTATSISSASTNNLATVKLYTGTANGVGTSELTNATAVSGPIGIMFACTLTYGSVGAM